MKLQVLVMLLLIVRTTVLTGFELLEAPSQLRSWVEAQQEPEGDEVKLHYEITYPKDFDLDLFATRDHLLVGFSPMPAPFLLADEQVGKAQPSLNGMQKQAITYTLLPLEPFTMAPQAYLKKRDAIDQKQQQSVLAGEPIVIEKVSLPPITSSFRLHQLDINEGLLPLGLDSEIEEQLMNRDKSLEIAQRLTNRQLPWGQILLSFAAALFLILVTFVWRQVNEGGFNFVRSGLTRLHRKIVERKLYRAAHRGRLRQLHYHLLARLLRDSLRKRQPRLPYHATVEEIEPLVRGDHELLEGVAYLKYCDEVRFSGVEKQFMTAKREREHFLCGLKWSCQNCYKKRE